jgi:TatA/E family protein of Tat protein translocase
VLLLFGAKKLPELSRSLGKSVSEFKKGMNEAEQPTETKAKENNATDDEKKKNSPVNPT